MKLNPKWEAALRAELQNASARIYQRVALADPWHRALTCCVIAQRIRAKRIRQIAARPSSTDPAQQMDWDAALKIAVRKARQHATHHPQKGGWDYALKLKLSSLRLRRQASARGKAFGPAK